MSIWPRLVWDVSRNACELAGQRAQVSHKPQMKAEDFIIIESVRLRECQEFTQINQHPYQKTKHRID